MSDLVKTYIRKPMPIEAVELTRKNYKEVAIWCGGRVVEIAKSSDPTDVYIGVDIPTLEKAQRANIGDYIFKNAVGAFHIFEGHYFLNHYDEVKSS